jgi:hypothetical protein
VTTDRLDPTVIAEWLRKSRADQGLPARITDGVVLSRIVTLALGTDLPNARSSDRT